MGGRLKAYVETPPKTHFARFSPLLIRHGYRRASFPRGKAGARLHRWGSEMVLAFCIKWMYDWTGLMDLIYFFNFSQVRRKRHANIYLRPGGRAPV